jgi:hypothetical protein
MPQRKKGQQTHERSEGVQIRLEPTLKQQARIYLTMAQMTWNDLLEPCIRHFVDAARVPIVQPPKEHVAPSQGQDAHPLPPLDLTQILRDGRSVELLLGSATYRRWIHRCTRCQRLWVAEKAMPEKCVHCKSPYWHTPRTRRPAGDQRTSKTPSGEARTRPPE